MNWCRPNLPVPTAPVTDLRRYTTPMQSPARPARILRFGIFELDCDARELRKRGVMIKIQDQPLDILLMLVERPGDLIARDEIRNRLWRADTFVEFEQSIGTAVRKLRTALGDNADLPHVIETVPRRGFRFLLPVTPATVSGSMMPEEVPLSASFGADGGLLWAQRSA